MTTSPAYDWSQFTKRININAPVSLVYDMWSTQSGMEKWFLRLAEFTKKTGALRRLDEHYKEGDNYKWLWHGYPDSAVEFGEIKAANGKDFMLFTFCAAGAKTDMQVSVTIKREEETIVELKQFNIPQDERGKINFHLGCMEGWVFYLTNLKSILEGGIDLRNKNVNVQRVLTA
ncbi:SRPBCC domain-containing protein [Chitinophagaceae bacterium LWZ2-11]